MIDVIVPGAEVEPLPVILPGSDASIYTRQGSNKSFASSPEKQVSYAKAKQLRALDKKKLSSTYYSKNSNQTAQKPLF